MRAASLALLFVAGLALVQGATYDYGEVIKKSLLFYQAQRSGKLSGMNSQLSWRKDSALKDKGDDGEDLTGGYYDAGDYVKFGFTMASTITVLAWGAIDFESGYSSIGQLSEIRAAVKWGTDYFIKAHVSANKFYGQVGNGDLDHQFWGRPEDMAMKRPAYKIDKDNPGSDLAAETAAALAAASIIFKYADPNYSNTLLAHARQLYEFADKYRGKYSSSIKDAKDYYPSYSYHDELVWGALWLYRATNDKSYLDKGVDYYKKWDIQYNDSPLSWDDKDIGATALLAKLTGEDKYKKTLQSFCDNFFQKQKKTPKGLIFISEWGALRYTANNVLICLQAAEVGIKASEYRALGQKQIDYMLGDAGRSFVVGFGKNPPQQPHHASSSCSPAPAVCDWGTYSSSKPNYSTLHGALVGGPDAKDKYDDVRTDYIKNEVTCDYNAGFQSALAALKARGL